jgi:hypothetical protein
VGLRQTGRGAWDHHWEFTPHLTTTPKDSLGELLTGLIALLDDDAVSVRRAALASLLKMCEARARLAMIGQESWRDVEKGKRPTNSGVATMVARK